MITLIQPRLSLIFQCLCDLFSNMSVILLGLEYNLLWFTPSTLNQKWLIFWCLILHESNLLASRLWGSVLIHIVLGRVLFNGRCSLISTWAYLLYFVGLKGKHTGMTPPHYRWNGLLWLDITVFHYWFTQPETLLTNTLIEITEF